MSRGLEAIKYSLIVRLGFQVMIDWVLRTASGQLLRRTLGMAFDLPIRGIPLRSEPKEPIQQLIPPHVVQTWEINEFGRRHRRSLLNMRESNQNLEFELLDRTSRDEFMMALDDSDLSQIYFDSRFSTMRADIFRYAYIFEHGGYYCDISMNHKGPITEQHSPGASAVITFEGNSALRMAPKGAAERLDYPTNLMAIWLFGFTAGHPIIKILLDQIKMESEDFRGKTFISPKSAIIALTGPAAFTRAVWTYLDEVQDASVEFVGIDFNQSGAAHKGAGFRHIQYPSYANARNEGLFQ